MNVRNRIVAHSDEDPTTLIPHPYNARIHPAIQRQAAQNLAAELRGRANRLKNTTVKG